MWNYLFASILFGGIALSALLLGTYQMLLKFYCFECNSHQMAYQVSILEGNLHCVSTMTLFFCVLGQYLKEHRLQPQTFIPLQSVRVKPVQEKLRTLGGTAKLVYDVIQYPHCHLDIMIFFCINVLSFYVLNDAYFSISGALVIVGHILCCIIGY